MTDSNQFSIAPPHSVGHFSEEKFVTRPGREDHSKGLLYTPLISRKVGSVHMGLCICELEPGGHVDIAIHAFEIGVFVLSGKLDFWRDGRAWSLSNGGYALIPTGTKHAWRNSDSVPVSWIEVGAPQPKDPGGWVDTRFLGEPSWPDFFSAPEFQDPTLYGLGQYKQQLQPPPAFMSPGLNGFSMRMLMDSNFGATHFNMFIIGFPDGGLCDHHDHPFEEAYFVLDGEIDCIFDDIPYTLKKGDFGWTGVGSQHGFFPRKGQPALWFEVQVPQPPRREWQRWRAAWDYINSTLKVPK